jgi:hypothetical protein
VCDQEDDGGDGALLIEGGVLCGSLSDHELVFTGEPLFDGHFDAVSHLSLASAAVAGKIDTTIVQIGTAFGVSDGTAEGVAETAMASLAANTEAAGLSLQVGELGCGIRVREVRSALARCDLEAFGDFTALPCAGDCRVPARGQSCDDGEARCRGLSEDLACDGACIGACTVEIETPAVCEGTCNGTCSGACPDDGSGGCLGPC